MSIPEYRRIGPAPCDDISPIRSAFFWMSRPCAVSAQMTAMSTAIMVMPQIG